MRILFATAQILSIVSFSDLQAKKSNFGGWTMALINQIKSYDMQIAIAMCGDVNKTLCDEVDGIKIYILPIVGKNKSIDSQSCDYVIEDFRPDIIQIEGTEFAIQNEFSKPRGIHRLVSLQGILEGYEPYQYGQLPMDELMTSHSLANRIVAKVLRFRKRHFFDDRLQMELETIENADSLTGRTFWDRAHSYWINKEAKYYKCNRILRDTFYSARWSANYTPHTIFTSNGSSALKGLHILIEALSVLKSEFPDVHLFVAGPRPSDKPSITKPKTLGYMLYIDQLIERLHLEKHISFLGMLSEVDMAKQLSVANVYVLPSLIENSPNSLGEAMIMGVPCISAYTGGVSDMADESEVLFYRANDPKLLAWEIKRVFDSEELVAGLSTNARKRAMETHDKTKNAEAMVRAYEDILGSSIARTKCMDKG